MAVIFSDGGINGPAVMSTPGVFTSVFQTAGRILASFLASRGGASQRQRCSSSGSGSSGLASGSRI
jgi:hypothetical protein